MPIYEYSCAACGATIEVLQSISAAPLQTHDGCGGSLERLVSAPTTRVGDQHAPPGSSHSSVLQFHENRKIAADKNKKKP